MWIMSSEEFLNVCDTNKNGKHVGTHSIWFNGYRTNKTTGKKEAYRKEKFNKFLCDDFTRFH